MTAVGILWVDSGRRFWRKQWRRAIFGSIIGYGIEMVAAMAAWPGFAR